MDYLNSASFALAVGALLSLFVLWNLAKFIIEPYQSPLRDLPGPSSRNWLFGQFRIISNSPVGAPQEEWFAKYGKNIRYSDLLNRNRLLTMDTRALNHIVTHSAAFQKDTLTRKVVGHFIGNGILLVEGEDHRRHRRVLNPAFGPVQIRQLTPVFLTKGSQLRDIWMSEIGENDQLKQIDVLSWMSRTTLDIIGLAGFDYDFQSLEVGKKNELSEAFKGIFGGSNTARLWSLLQLGYPILKIIPSARNKRMAEARLTMNRIGMKMVEERKKAIMSGKIGQMGGIAQKDLEGRDLLSLLLKANLAVDIPASQKLSDEEVLAQIPAFLVAGHETTANSMTWCLYSLTQSPHVQDKLRQELLSVDTDMPTMDQLVALPYLEMVVRETLRLHAPVPFTTRQAIQDDIIPVAEPYIDRHGNVRNNIRVSKGDVIVVPILPLNRSTDTWGADAAEFKPERWENPPSGTEDIPGIWGHILTFLGGPRACIGYRFSLVEMKALLFVLLRSFEFELAVDPATVSKAHGGVTRPVISSEAEENRMPLLVRPYRP